ncbi:hypothetical protein [Cytobacillus oceanisediminis]|uniref:hypothetical protein n=1 Tax=Cytobacillus oceanisediminis TaxID=665099 RepID=UPI00254AD59C|nr:hypothetical protein [Cytobacillus oceanisediminis]MDK7669288.1 hypothetical protein [Cytobacillus oceanisediminis]
MSGTPALSYKINRAGNRPQEVIVDHNGEVKTFLFGPHVSERKIVEMIPRLVLDFRTRRKKAV